MKDKLFELGAFVSLLWILAHPNQFRERVEKQARVYTSGIQALMEKSE